MNVVNRQAYRIELKQWGVKQPYGMTRRNSTRRRAGFTLVEVMVALAIFVIGAIAIVRIFPPAFGVIQGSEYRAIATRMDRTTLSRLTNEPGLMPDATYAVDNTGAWTSPVAPGPVTPIPLALVGTTSRNLSIPNDVIPQAYANSALAHFKRVVGEKHKIRREATTNQLFVLTRHPYATGSVILYREGEVNGVKIHTKADGPPVNLTPPVYNDGELDFKNATLASDPSKSFSDPGSSDGRLPPSDMRGNNVTYYVSYRWMENGREQGVIDEPLIITGSPARVLQGLRLGTNDYVIPGSVSVRFRMAVTPTTAATNNDDFRGYIPIANGAGLSTPAPLPPQQPVYDTQLTVGDVVSVDYTVKDWRWLVHDDTPNKTPPIPEVTGATPPPANEKSLTVPARPLMDDPTSIAGLSATTPGTVFTLLSGIDSTTGNTVMNRAYWDGQTITGTGVASVNPKVGRITYNTTNVSNNTVRGPRARTVFWTLDGWAHQISVAARSYVPYYSGFSYNPRQQWREYIRGDESTTNTFLYFHPGEAGKAVLVSYRYQEGAGGTVRDAAAIYTIDDSIIPMPSGNSNGTMSPTNFVSRLEITRLNGNALAYADLVSILAVQGVSIHARTAWQDNARYQQAIVAGYRTAEQL